MIPVPALTYAKVLVPVRIAPAEHTLDTKDKRNEKKSLVKESHDDETKKLFLLLVVVASWS